MDVSLRFIVVIVLLTGLSACVSRYDPVEKVHPLSGDCRDFAAFSRALAIQRDNGLTRRANMTIAAYSVAGEQQRQEIYMRYQIMLDLAYADRFVDPDSISLMGKITCEQRQRGEWREPAQRDLPQIANIIKACRQQSLNNPESEACIIRRLEYYWNEALASPPALNES